MIWRKLRQLSLWQQGALNGFISGSILTVPLMVYCLLDSCKSGYQESSGGSIMASCMCDRVNLWFTLESILLVTIASLIVQITVAKRIRSTIVLWQIIGAVTVSQLYFYVPIKSFIKEWTECVSYDWEASFCKNVNISTFLEQFLERPQSSVFIQLATAFAIIAVYNLIFAVILNRLKVQLP